MQGKEKRERRGRASTQGKRTWERKCPKIQSGVIQICFNKYYIAFWIPRSGFQTLEKKDLFAAEKRGNKITLLCCYQSPPPRIHFELDADIMTRRIHYDHHRWLSLEQCYGKYSSGGVGGAHHHILSMVLSICSLQDWKCKVCVKYATVENESSPIFFLSQCLFVFLFSNTLVVQTHLCYNSSNKW